MFVGLPALLDADPLLQPQSLNRKDPFFPLGIQHPGRLEIEVLNAKKGHSKEVCFVHICADLFDL